MTADAICVAGFGLQAHKLWRSSQGLPDATEFLHPRQDINNLDTQLQRRWEHAATLQPGPDISALDTELQHQWHHSANQHLGNKSIKRFSNLLVWWKCDQCPDGHLHQWQTTVYSRTAGTGCPQCSGHKVCKHSSLATRYPEVAQYWDVSKNGCTADEIFPKSRKKADWRCDACKHEWRVHKENMILNKNKCPACNDGHGSQQPTFAGCQHHLLSEWDHVRNAAEGLYPWNTTLGSHKRVHWTCSKCVAGQQHSWTATPYDRTQRQTGCPFCAGKSACTCNSLQTRYPAVAAEWHPTLNRKTPDECVGMSHTQVWWHNAHRGSWQQRIDSRVKAIRRDQAAGR